MLKNTLTTFRPLATTIKGNNENKQKEDDSFTLRTKGFEELTTTGLSV